MAQHLVSDKTGKATKVDPRRVMIVAVIGLPLLWLSIAATVPGIFGRRAPDAALAWWPWSADAAAAKSSRLVLGNPDGASRRKAEALAAAALARQPVTPIAARSLALAWSLEPKHTDRVARLMQYSEALSRHDLPTQLWLLETRVQRDDIAGALIHYDRALRSAPQVREQLLPILVAAAHDPAVARPLGVLLARGPSWRNDFAFAFLPKAGNAATLAILLPTFKLDPRSGIDRSLLGMAIDRMVVLSQPALALRIYRQIAPVAEGRERVNNADFARDPGPQPFDWSFNTDNGLAASREPADGGGYRLRGSVPAGVSGWLARQTLVLTPGAYRLAIQATGDAASGSVLTARLTCAGGAALAGTPVANGRSVADVTVPAFGCATAILSLDVQGGLDGPPSDYLVRLVSLIRR